MAGYAVNNDLSGFVAVDGPEDVGADQYFSETPPDIPRPVVAPPATPTDARRLLLGAAAIGMSDEQLEDLFRQAFNFAG